jgi:hypothetical protein
VAQRDERSAADPAPAPQATPPLEWLRSFWGKLSYRQRTNIKYVVPMIATLYIMAATGNENSAPSWGFSPWPSALLSRALRSFADTVLQILHYQIQPHEPALLQAISGHVIEKALGVLNTFTKNELNVLYEQYYW